MKLKNAFLLGALALGACGGAGGETGDISRRISAEPEVYGRGGGSWTHKSGKRCRGELRVSSSDGGTNDAGRGGKLPRALPFSSRPGAAAGGGARPGQVVGECGLHRKPGLRLRFAYGLTDVTRHGFDIGDHRAGAGQSTCGFRLPLLLCTPRPTLWPTFCRYQVCAQSSPFCTLSGRCAPVIPRVKRRPN